MVIGTSALPGHRIDGAVNIYAGIYNNPFLIWGSYRREWFRARLPLSFQFHHTQMDGAEAARFLDRLQAEIDKFYPTGENALSPKHHRDMPYLTAVM